MRARGDSSLSFSHRPPPPQKYQPAAIFLSLLFLRVPLWQYALCSFFHKVGEIIRAARDGDLLLWLCAVMPTQ
jgi:hypothetical protein